MASLVSFSSTLSTIRTTIQVHAKGGCNFKVARFPCSRASRLRVSCSQAASAETVQKVCDIVKKQLALPADTVVTPESQFSELGADSLDTVEIVMNLEEEFGITVEEDNSQSITTVQEAANLIHKLVQSKA